MFWIDNDESGSIILRILFVEAGHLLGMIHFLFLETIRNGLRCFANERKICSGR